MYEAQLEFPEDWGIFKKIPFMGDVRIFSELHIFLCLLWLKLLFLRSPFVLQDLTASSLQDMTMPAITEVQDQEKT